MGSPVTQDVLDALRLTVGTITSLAREGAGEADLPDLIAARDALEIEADYLGTSPASQTEARAIARQAEVEFRRALAGLAGAGRARLVERIEDLNKDLVLAASDIRAEHGARLVRRLSRLFVRATTRTTA